MGSSTRIFGVTTGVILSICFSVTACAQTSVKRNEMPSPGAIKAASQAGWVQVSQSNVNGGNPVWVYKGTGSSTEVKPFTNSAAMDNSMRTKGIATQTDKNGAASVVMSSAQLQARYDQKVKFYGSKGVESQGRTTNYLRDLGKALTGSPTPAAPNYQAEIDSAKNAGWGVGVGRPQSYETYSRKNVTPPSVTGTAVPTAVPTSVTQVPVSNTVQAGKSGMPRLMETAEAQKDAIGLMK